VALFLSKEFCFSTPLNASGEQNQNGWDENFIKMGFVFTLIVECQNNEHATCKKKI
jgi:hypothetical protein